MKKTAITYYRRLLQATAGWRGDDFLAGKIEPAKMKEIIQQNRQALKQVNDWMPSGLIAQSVFRYGVNPEVEPLLNLSPDERCTHTDLLAYFGHTAREPLRYLELGVSVGKTFWQILNTCVPSECWGFDIEEINPVLKSRLVEVSRQEWAGPASSIKKTPSSISRFTHPATGNRVVYVCADIFDPKAWEVLAGNNFNLILSDALHTPEALEFEWNQMAKMSIFNQHETVIMWDDLNGEMRDWFQSRRVAIASQLSIGPQQVGAIYMNGWLGRGEFPHRLGLAIKYSATSAGKRD
jgi:hypothetical protein